ncbi:M3 family oligoendopeptidase [Tuberibacillus sp. Marseille-P3662]|uniref:M3 family oligoendopeptidase n=1 Tax=Tuberibacillus sp. Marseille-P3662 TaxID=1965358 RepID=UPI000A1CAADC|nr:M3 family oligoendopeptidase [Tuberibacillus sp. Marseille-P3662]
MEQTLQTTWDLDAIFTDGSESQSFRAFLSTLKQDVASFYDRLNKATAPKSVDEADAFKHDINMFQDLTARLGEAESFIGCLRAQNIYDKKAVELSATLKSIDAEYQSCETLLEQHIAAIPGDVWSDLLQEKPLNPYSYILNEKRQDAHEQLPSDQEQLIHALSVDGYHGWSDMHDSIVGETTITYNDPVKGEQNLSVGQADNLLSDSDRSVRQAVADSWEEAWRKQEDLLAQTLNSLAGFRLNVYDKRGWDHVLKEPLTINRMSESTLNAMWQVIETYKPKVVEYLQTKAKYMGLDQLSWTDVEAPLDSTDTKMSFDEGAEFIIEKFNNFNPDMARFAKHALEHRWVEAEDRSGKEPGGFCTSFPLSEESRIFMTYSGTPGNVSTLAHELGHAYHSHVMQDMATLNQDYPMNLAETASTFAENIVADAAIRSASTDSEQLALLDDKLQRAVAFFMNIHARFLFETRFYEERKNGFVNAERLNELMVQAQKDAYKDALADYHPHFWASKLHFYITEVPFYNFPYTFGYMFSMGIYARAAEEGPAFAEKYDALLRDTGSMKVEDLAVKHLGVDLTQPDFWEGAAKQVAQDVDTFIDIIRNIDASTSCN